MQVVRAPSAGFCLGVSLALRRLDAELAAFLRAREENSALCGRLITLGPVIHNPLVMRHYADQGVLCESNPAGIGMGDRVIIRAHGITRDIEARLKTGGAGVVDATCPKVKKAQTAIGKQCARGGVLLLFGEKDHPEVKGLLSYAGEGALVFGDLNELAGLALDEKASYYLAAQTTQDRTIFLQAREYLTNLLGQEIPMLDTICDATRRRQEEVISLALDVQAMVVVGGLNSGNTRRLAEVARAQGVPTVHVEQAADMTPEMLRTITNGVCTVGLTAGASTPDEHIAAMQIFLEAL